MYISIALQLLQLLAVFFMLAFLVQSTDHFLKVLLGERFKFYIAYILTWAFSWVLILFAFFNLRQLVTGYAWDQWPYSARLPILVDFVIFILCTQLFFYVLTKIKPARESTDKRKAARECLIFNIILWFLWIAFVIYIQGNDFELQSVSQQILTGSVGFIYLSVVYIRMLHTQNINEATTGTNNGTLLYLRPFVFDKKTFKSKFNPLAILWQGHPIVSQRFDVFMHNATKKRRIPLVALGSPADFLPTLNSGHRSYYSDHNWESAVLHFIDASIGIVMEPSNSENTNQELMEITRQGAFQKLYVLTEPKSNPVFHFFRGLHNFIQRINTDPKAKTFDQYLRRLGYDTSGIHYTRGQIIAFDANKRAYVIGQKLSGSKDYLNIILQHANSRRAA